MAKWEEVRDQNKEQIESFNKLWHGTEDGTWHLARWLGVKVLKTPCDLMVYQEIITSLKPGLIIETGTCFGGSALYMATICQLLNRGQVVTIDINPPRTPIKHPRVTCYTGSSTDPKTIAYLQRLVSNTKGHVLVILDSDHRRKHVLKELELYSPFVTKGSYLIVEDTGIGKTIRLDHGPGPGNAVDEWLPNNPHYVIDKSCERYFLTFNPSGYLKRIR